VPPDQIHPYALAPESTFQRGCFPPCLCPLQVPRPISGTFTLVELGPGPLFTEFAVVNVDWLVAESGWWPALPVRGVGTYRVGGEFAVQQQLSLDLIVNDKDQAHFDSGLVLGGGDFPRISSLISIDGMRCFDTVIDVRARPAPTLRLSASVNEQTFAAGQTLTVGGAVTNPGLPEAADFYMGIVRPDGAIQFFTNTGIVFGSVAKLASFQPLAVGVPLGTPFSLTAPSFYSHQWTGTDAHGTYVFFVGAVKTGALAGDSLPSGTILGLATAAFSFP